MVLQLTSVYGVSALKFFIFLYSCQKSSVDHIIHSTIIQLWKRKIRNWKSDFNSLTAKRMDTLSKTIAYPGESKNKLQFFCLSDFQSYHPLRLLLLHINYIQLQRLLIIKIKNYYDVCKMENYWPGSRGGCLKFMIMI